MIDAVKPAVEPLLTHHGAEVQPIVQLLAAAGVGFSMIVLAVRGAISGIRIGGAPPRRLRWGQAPRRGRRATRRCRSRTSPSPAHEFEQT